VEAGLRDLTLLGTGLRVVLGVVAAAAVGALVAWRRPGWRRRLLCRWLPGVAVVDVVLTWSFRRGTRITDHLPPSFHVWVGLVVLALLAGARRRALATVVVAVLAAANAFVQVNGHYGYFPTVGTVLGRPPPEAVGAARLAAELRAWPTPPTPRPKHGQLVPLDIAPTASHLRHRAGSVWLPPAYFDARRARLPVVLMLSGAPGSAIAWSQSGFATRTADAYAQAHDGVAPILVFTDQNGSVVGDTECVDGPRGNAETFLTVDFAGFLHDRLHVHPPPDRTAVVGFSEGGTCALVLALRHPDLFGRLGDLAGDGAPNIGSPARTLRTLFGGDQAAMDAHDPALLLSTRRYPNLAAWVVTGRRDRRHLATGRAVAARLRAAGARVSSSRVGGGHDWPFAGRALRRVLPALADHMLAPPSAA
jgi:S-formylglutathione hydrolase FrmB